MQYFGVSNEAIPKKINYRIDAAQTIGENGTKSYYPNTVVSFSTIFREIMDVVSKSAVNMQTTVQGKILIRLS